MVNKAVGYDAHQTIKGRKRHTVVDTFTLPILSSFKYSLFIPVPNNFSISFFIGQVDYLTMLLRCLSPREGFQFCLFWGAMVAIALGISGILVASAFYKDPEVVEVAAKYLLIVPISYGAFGIISISHTTFNALGKPLPSMLITVVRMLFLYVPLAYLESVLFGINGILLLLVWRIL